MATEEWLQAARNYSRMTEQERGEYWGRLAPDQQGLLRAALISTGQDISSSSATVEQSSSPARRGCGSPLVAGCIGMILGCVLTLGVEVVAIMMGVEAVSSLFQGPSDTYPGTSQRPDISGSAYDPREQQKQLDQELEEYRQQQ